MPDTSLETHHDGPFPPPASAAPSPDLAFGKPSQAPSPTAPIAPPLRPGQLSVAWQIMLTAAWSAAFFAFAAVWKTSEEIGIGTWWLGPRAQPQPLLVRIAPFAITMVLGLLTVYNVRRIAIASAAASLLVAGIAVFDISRSGGLAAIELAIAASLLLVSVGALVATIRAAPVQSMPDLPAPR